MKPAYYILAITINIVAVTGCQTKVDSVATALPPTPELTVFEGLPHQHWEEDLLAKELESKETIRIAGHPFYQPTLEIGDADKLAIVATLSDPKARRQIHGNTVKTCGGFHPDYAVCWTADKRKYCVLVCFGCAEFEFYRDEEQVARYDIRSMELMTILDKYHNLRPESDHRKLPAWLKSKK